MMEEYGEAEHSRNSSIAIDNNVLHSAPLPFVVDEQRITIHRVDFVNKAIFMSTDLDVRVQYGWPGVQKGSLGFNCRNAAITGIRVNGESTSSFSYADPWTLTDGISDEGGGDEAPPRDNDELTRRMAVAAETTDSDCQNGEFWITNIPRPPVDEELAAIANSAEPNSSDLEDAVIQLEWNSLTVSIEYVLEQPENGVVFVIPRCENGELQTNESLIQRGAHVYTSSTSNARDWLPCLDSPSAVCKWRIDFHLPPPLVAVSCGESLQAETQEGSQDRKQSFTMNFPVPASLIGFAIGAFESMTDENMREIQHFCPPGGLVNLLEPTTNCLQTVFEFFEENLACSYPFPAYRQVFVHGSPQPLLSFASMSVISAACLCNNDSIEGQMATRRIHAEAIARQYFGCVVLAEPGPGSLTSRLSPSWWLVPSLARYVASLYNRRAFGNNEDKAWVMTENTALADFELNRLNGNALRLDIESSTPFQVEPYADMTVRKGSLILRLIEIKITNERLLHVLSVLLGKSVKREMSILTRSDFVQNVSIISGTQIGEFMARFEGSASIRMVARYAYSRRRSALQVSLQQQNGPTMYAGPVTVVIQEMDGHYSHVVQMSGRSIAVELPIHSKPKKTRKRRVVLSSGEEIDIDVTGADLDCVLLWIRVDPNFALLRANNIIIQPDYAWQFQIELDRDVCGQLDSAVALKQFPTAAARARLESAIMNDHFFYRVRCAAALSMAENLILTNENLMATSGNAPTPMSAQPLISLFKRLFASRTCSQLPRPNNFSNIQSYFVQQALVEAIAACQARDGLDFLVSLLTYNDNSRNKFSDALYVSTMCLQLAKCLSPSPIRCNLSDSASGNPNMNPSAPAGIVVSELVTRLNIDTLPSPTASFAISRACISALRHLQKLGYLPNNPQFYQSYINFPHHRRRGSVFHELRLEAFRCLVECILSSDSEEEAVAADVYSEPIIELILQDEDICVRYAVVDLLLATAQSRPHPGEKSRSARHTLFTRLLPSERLWNAVLLANDLSIRSRLAALYEALYSPEALELLNSANDGRNSAAILQTSHDGGTSLSPPPIPKKKHKKDKSAHLHHGEAAFSSGASAAGGTDSQTELWNPTLMSLDDEDGDENFD